MTRWQRFWIAVNTFAATFTDPYLTGAAAAPLRNQQDGDGRWATGLPADGRQDAPGHGFHPFRMTLIDTPTDLIGQPGFLPERAWWDQRGENNPQPIDPPERLDLSGLRNYDREW